MASCRRKPNPSAPSGVKDTPAMTAGQFLISQRLYAEVEDDVEVEPVGEFVLKGFQRPIAAFNVIAIREPAKKVPATL